MRQEFTKRTKLLAFERSGGRCEQCSARLSTGQIEYHHKIEATMGGGNDLANCFVFCRSCHSGITRKRANVIAKSNRQRAKHIGLHCGRQSFLTNKSGPFKKKINGTIERRR